MFSHEHPVGVKCKVTRLFSGLVSHARTSGCLRVGVPGTGPRHREFRLKFRVGAELERLDPVRLDFPLAPNPGHAGEGDPPLDGQEPS
jgi:hypothetical protein